MTVHSVQATNMYSNIIGRPTNVDIQESVIPCPDFTIPNTRVTSKSASANQTSRGVISGGVLSPRMLQRTYRNIIRHSTSMPSQPTVQYGQMHAWPFVVLTQMMAGYLLLTELELVGINLKSGCACVIAIT